MKFLLSAFARIGSIILVGGLFALLLQTAWAVTGPDCDPADPAINCTVIPQFTALLVGSGTLPSANDLKVTGNAAVVGDVLTNSLNPYSGGTIRSDNTFYAEQIGLFYTDNKQCNYSDQDGIFGCDTVYVGDPVPGTNPIDYVFSSEESFLWDEVYASAKCDEGDEIVSCSGYAGNRGYDSSYGADIGTDADDYQFQGTYFYEDDADGDGLTVWHCLALGSFAGSDANAVQNLHLEANAFCFSPDGLNLAVGP